MQYEQKKKYYEVGEMIFLKNELKKGKVLSIDPKNMEITVSYFNNNVRETVIKKFWEITKYRQKDEIYFAKVRPDAKIPSKDRENGCYDIWPCFDEEYIEIAPGGIKMIPTGIASCFNPKYRLDLRERGSSGSKGLSKRCGQVDSGYRGEIFFALNNTTNKIIFISKKEFSGDGVTYYPYEKAICQAALEFVPNVNVKEISYEQLKEIPSKRGMGKLGSSGK